MNILIAIGYGVIFLITTWAVLNPRIPTKIVGTFGLSGIALASFSSIVVEPALYSANAVSIKPTEWMLVLCNALVGIWFFIRWVRRK